MRWCDDTYFKILEFCYGFLDLRAIPTNYIGKISEDFVFVICHVQFVVKDPPIETSETAKGITREKSFCPSIIGDHCLRPVNHRDQVERKGMFPGIQGFSILYDMEIIFNGIKIF